ncbi:MAG: Ig-like domain-containing protein [Vicinamibacterales bacterium]
MALATRLPLKAAIRVAAVLAASAIVPTAPSGVALAQGTTRSATTASALIASAGFYHGKNVVIDSETTGESGLTRLAGTARPIFVLLKDRVPGGKGEIRGEFWDLGRIEQGDSRFSGHDFAQLLEATTRGRWPRRDEVYIIIGAALLPSSPAAAPSLRAIALRPDEYEGREVKVVGRFKGRNLYADLPQALGKTKWDFVLQSAEGALWVTGVRPKGKGFDLDPVARVDTGRWLEVTGVVSIIGSTPYITASALQLATAPQTLVEVPVPEQPRMPAPEVIFSAPVPDDRDVEVGVRVRIQFSRDIDPRTIEGHIRVSYIASPTGEASAPPLPAFTMTYNDVAHAIEIRFAQPLPRFQQVKVELLEGIIALDRQAVKPWTLTFTTGGT